MGVFPQMKKKTSARASTNDDLAPRSNLPSKSLPAGVFPGKSAAKKAKRKLIRLYNRGRKP